VPVVMIQSFLRVLKTLNSVVFPVIVSCHRGVVLPILL